MTGRGVEAAEGGKDCVEGGDERGGESAATRETSAATVVVTRSALRGATRKRTVAADEIYAVDNRSKPTMSCHVCRLSVHYCTI